MKKYIKKIEIISFIIYGLFVITSCNKKLDIQPSQSVDTKSALKTSSDVKAALVGAYSKMGGNSVYGGRLYLESDLLSNDGEISFTGTYAQLSQINNKQIPVDNSFVATAWLSLYETINITNNILASINIVDSVSRKKVAAESKFIRGSMYFELVKLYSKTWDDGDNTKNPGVPLILSPTLTYADAVKDVARNSVSEVYMQILKDLTEAEADLPSQNGFYATKGAANAMLSRVYLMQNDYTSARDAADKVIQSALYKLTLTYADEFPTPGQIRVLNTVEDIFAIQISEQQGVNSLNEFYAASNYGGRGDIELNSDSLHLLKYEKKDDRLNLFYDDGGSIRTGKFNNQYGNVKVIRLAEMYLTRAECNFRLMSNVGDSPLNDVNFVRKRVNLTNLLSGNLSLQKILNERYLELAFEGQSLSDIKRTKGVVNSYDNKGKITVYNYNSPKLIFPIPQREIQVNKLLVQNEGYQ